VSKVVRPDPPAEEEFAREIRRYEAESPGLGNDLWIEIQHGISLISEHPLIGNVIPRTRVIPPARRLRLRRFPFYLIYREFENEIELVALAPMSRRPGYWRSRTR